MTATLHVNGLLSFESKVIDAIFTAHRTAFLAATDSLSFEQDAQTVAQCMSILSNNTTQLLLKIAIKLNLTQQLISVKIPHIRYLGAVS